MSLVSDGESNNNKKIFLGYVQSKKEYVELFAADSKMLAYISTDLS